MVMIGSANRLPAGPIPAGVAAGHHRFIFTSTTSLMVSQAIRRDSGAAAAWLDESFGPLAPRNVYGVTKLAAEGLCRLQHIEHGLNSVILRIDANGDIESGTEGERYYIRAGTHPSPVLRRRHQWPRFHPGPTG